MVFGMIVVMFGLAAAGKINILLERFVKVTFCFLEPIKMSTPREQEITKERSDFLEAIK